ncbi:hypothetical protein SAMN05443634_10378 [Chishuiella changwenlii]|uniref:Toprim-like n=1 Tax=Chishuiella changwenlii TaxID=1434701 RepID=A0A1M6UVQ2_9FLAO|nr:DUF6371 domain-containing protein [Chishuiella changwenlii]GGF07871.1 hypothetical protein GCM10010984_26300 [Chishuiella changwenlii]SHK73136.1 hypothetical protein SAMN05443634_10378 [Chishuiella changwenlii]
MKENFKYSLEKYSGSKSRFICPNCKEKEYTRFINSETKEYLSYEFGRCNRIIKCGYFKSPTLVNNFNYQKNNEFIEPKIEYLDKNVFQFFESTNFKNPLSIFLKSYFDESKVEEVLDLYKVKTEKRNGDYLTIFPQLDFEFYLRTIKKMKYNFQTGKRSKNFFQWYNPNKSNLKQCLFGLHLLNHFEFKKSKIIIVESEKTALLGMLYFKNKYLFLATGGLMNLTKDKLKTLENREIILMPDLSPIDSKNSAFDYWKTKSEKFSNELNCSISISNLLEEKASIQQRNLQLDLGDFIIEELSKKSI